VAVSACITIGYDVPWRQVHALLLEAASTIDGICPGTGAKRGADQPE